MTRTLTEDTYSEAETAARREAALKRMLATPHKPHQPIKGAAKHKPVPLRVETSFQDTPGDGLYWALWYEGRPLADQLSTLGLRDGDKVTLWEEDCGDFTMQAALIFNFQHPMFAEPRLWAKEIVA